MQLVDIQLRHLGNDLQPFDIRQAKQHLALADLAAGLDRRVGVATTGRGVVAGGGYHDAGERRLHLLGREQGAQGLVFHGGVGQLHIGDLAVFALALFQRLLQFAAGRGEVQLLLLGLLAQVVQFVARDDAAFEQILAFGEFALRVVGAHLRGAQAAAGAADGGAAVPVLHFLHGAPGLELGGEGIAQLHFEGGRVHAQQHLAGLDPLALLDQIGLHIAVKRRGEHERGVGLDFAHQADLMHQRVGLDRQPLLGRAVGSGGRAAQGQPHAAQQQDQHSAQQGFSISSH